VWRGEQGTGFTTDGIAVEHEVDDCTFSFPISTVMFHLTGLQFRYKIINVKLRAGRCSRKS